MDIKTNEIITPEYEKSVLACFAFIETFCYAEGEHPLSLDFNPPAECIFSIKQAIAFYQVNRERMSQISAECDKEKATLVVPGKPSKAEGQWITTHNTKIEYIDAIVDILAEGYVARLLNVMPFPREFHSALIDTPLWLNALMKKHTNKEIRRQFNDWRGISIRALLSAEVENYWLPISDQCTRLIARIQTDSLVSDTAYWEEDYPSIYPFALDDQTPSDLTFTPIAVYKSCEKTVFSFMQDSLRLRGGSLCAYNFSQMNRSKGLLKKLFKTIGSLPNKPDLIVLTGLDHLIEMEVDRSSRWKEKISSFAKEMLDFHNEQREILDDPNRSSEIIKARVLIFADLQNVDKLADQAEDVINNGHRAEYLFPIKSVNWDDEE